MRKISISLFLLVFSVNLISSSFNELGDFKYEKISEQIKQYESLYEDIVKKEPPPDFPYSTHSDKLFDKLKNAFILTRDFIKNKENPKEEDLEKFKKYLETLYNASMKLNNEQNKMSFFHFERINFLCALIASAFYDFSGAEEPQYNAKSIWNGDKSFNISSFKTALDEGQERVIKYIKDDLDNIPFFRRSPYLQIKGETQFFPMYVLYMNKDIPIGYQTIVNLIFNSKHPGFVAVFYPTAEKKESKQVVHFGIFNNLVAMLMHDYDHRAQMIDNMLLIKNKSGLSFLDYLNPIYLKSLKSAENVRKVLIHGLFLLTHDLFPIELLKNFTNIIGTKDFKKSISEDKSFFLNQIIDAIMEQTNFYLSYRGIPKYKKLIRDNEYILLGIHKHDGKPFLPLIKINNEEKFLPVAKNEKGEAAIILSSTDTTLTIRFINEEKETQINYTLDEQGNMELPKGWTWVSKEDRKKMEEVLKIRNTYAIEYLKKGFKEFWEYFRDIASEILKKQPEQLN